MTDWFTSQGLRPRDLGDDEERAIAAFMFRVASLTIPGVGTRDSGFAENRIPNPEARIPSAQDPARLWWKAQLLKKWEAERRAQLPLDVMHPIEIAGGLVAAGLMLYWSLPYLF
jgi:hypothetical protein